MIGLSIECTLCTDVCSVLTVFLRHLNHLPAYCAVQWTCSKSPGNYSCVALVELFAFHMGKATWAMCLLSKHVPLLKSTVDVHVKLPQHAKCVIDVGHLIHAVHRPYQQVCEPMSLTQYTTIWGSVTCSVWWLWQLYTSTKTVEHEHRTTHLISTDIMFECELKAFLANR